jgi:hypothetical protein
LEFKKIWSILEKKNIYLSDGNDDWQRRNPYKLKKNLKKFRNSRVSSLHIRLHILQSIKQNIDWKFWEGEGIAALHSRMSKMRKIQMAKHVNKKPQRISHRYNLMKWPLNSFHHWSLHHIIIITMATSSKITNWAHKSTNFFLFWW